ncbi:hypothetical protein BD414DRAFT_532925 [Trametes punicea]|nr:hypothetical protein BD414DRAFT_532925 [Trametes punicea]
MSSVLPPTKPSATYPLPVVTVDGDAAYPTTTSGAGSTGASFFPRVSPVYHVPMRPSCDLVAAALSPAPRPNVVRRETDQILSYYQSEHAGRPFDYATAAADHARTSSSTTHLRKASTFSSASEYSSESSDDGHVSSKRERDRDSGQQPASVDASIPYKSQLPAGVRATAESRPSAESARADGATARHSRRPSVPTEGGADRRRVAIVEMDSTIAPLSIAHKRSRGFDSKSFSSNEPATSTMSPGGTLYARRGMHIGGLALVAPPDASPKTYTNLTPPPTAPATADRAFHPPLAASSLYHHHHAHARSASEAVNSGSGSRHRGLHHKSSRDVGIVGLSSASTASDSLGPASPTSDDYHTYVQHEGLGVPLFQTPAKSRSPSPGGGTTPDLSDTSSASAHHRSPGQRLLSTPIFGMEDGIVTPGIGECKDIQQPVVGPVIVGLSPELIHRTTTAAAMATQQQEVQQRADASAASQQHAHTPQPTPPSVQSPASQFKSPLYQAPSSSPSSSLSPSSPYLHYKPGVHATAGPLPPPPRSIFETAKAAAPPRPPRFHTPVPPGTRREIEAIKEKLQLPQSVSAVLAARTPPEANRRLGHDPPPARPDTRASEESTYSQEGNNNDNGNYNNRDEVEESSVKLVPSSNSVHRREGAFPPSTIYTSPPGQQLVQSPRASEELSSTPHAESRPLVIVEHEHESEVKSKLEGVANDASLGGRERKDSDRRAGLELRRESSWVSLRQELGGGGERQSSPNGKSAVLPNIAVSVSRSASCVSALSSSSSSGSGSGSGSSRLPVPPPKNANRGSDDEKYASGSGLGSLAPSSFRATLTNLKRFSSLPRTPSRSSRSSKRSTSPSPGPRRSFSPGPPSAGLSVAVPTQQRVVPRPTLVSSWPPAMNVRDITILRSPRERARAYAEKINELAMYDCGLRDWMAASQGRPVGSHPRTQSQRTARSTLQAVPSEFGGMAPQGRHVSHGSLASEATFPIRPDAYTATDLSLRPIDVEPSTAPPPSLPYPALAQANITRTSTRTSTLLSSPTKTLAILPGAKSSGTGFFASLGRKTSVRREKGLSGLSPNPQSQSQSPNKVLTKRPPGIAASRSNPITSTSTPSRDAPLPTVPAIPGGPRAAPGRIQRAKTYSVSASPPRAETDTEGARGSQGQRQSAMARRPSLFARARQGHASVVPSAPAAADPAFQRQVEKLAAILPHADREILAGYLRRAGEDILAIGQYLEDEKNGTLRRD